MGTGKERNGNWWRRREDRGEDRDRGDREEGIGKRDKTRILLLIGASLRFQEWKRGRGIREEGKGRMLPSLEEREGNKRKGVMREEWKGQGVALIGRAGGQSTCFPSFGSVQRAECLVSKSLMTDSDGRNEASARKGQTRTNAQQR